MKRFSDIRRNRNTAFVMLLLWLFAISSGIVNACVLEPHGTDVYVTGVQTSTYAPPAVAGHAEALVGHNGHDGHDGQFDNSSTPCLKVCDDSSQALIKLKAFFDLADRGSALTDSMLWAAAIQVTSAHQHLDSSASATSEPPVRVRYSRLAL